MYSKVIETDNNIIYFIAQNEIELIDWSIE